MNLIISAYRFHSFAEMLIGTLHTMDIKRVGAEVLTAVIVKSLSSRL
jgi:hypothetical protein